MYEKYIKRGFDFLLALFALVLLAPLLLILIIINTFMMRGNPFFTQIRPGRMDKNGEETLFKMIKFRTMTNQKDENGKYLPDAVRLTKWGKFLRSTSLDELPELLNIIRGDMSFVGPRPQLVRDMLFMTPVQRQRHTVTPGLTGLAQCNGRNGITWERKFGYDLQYIETISFITDVKIILKTIGKVFARDGISEEGMETAEDFGDYLLRINQVDSTQYRKRLEQEKEMLENLSR